MATIAGGSRISDAELDLIEQIGRGEEAAFEHLVDTHGPALLRVASYHTPSRAIAEEVVQETWMAFLEGLKRFEGRSSLRTWLFGILINQARKTAQRERRSVPLFETERETIAEGEVSPERFMPAGVRWAGHWRLDDLSVWPRSWTELPDNRLLSREVRAEIAKALDPLPAPQRLRFEEHLSLCDGCTAYLDQTRQVIRLSRGLSEDELPEPLRQKFLLAFSDWHQRGASG